MRAPMPCRQKCARQRNHRRHVKFIFCYFPANLFKVFENNTKSLFLQRLNFETESETYFQIKCTQKSRQICYFTSFCAKVQITWKNKERKYLLRFGVKIQIMHFCLIFKHCQYHLIHWFEVCQILMNHLKYFLGKVKMWQKLFSNSFNFT